MRHPIIKFIGESAVGAFTLTTEPGAYSVTGQAVNLLAAHIVTAESGAYAVTGADAGLLAGVKITAESGSYSITGTDAELIANKVITAEAGSYSITGSDVALNLGALVTAEPGSYSITGQDVTLTHSTPGTFTLTAEAGSYTVIGTDVGLISDLVITAESGSYAVTGQDAGLNVSVSLLAEAGTYAVTGQDVAFPKDSRIMAESGSYSCVGSDVTLIYSGAPPVTEEAVTGGWYRREWRPTKEEIDRQRVELGITKKEADQITRVIKKVSKGQIIKEEAPEATKEYFEQKELEYQPKHRAVLDIMVEFIGQFQDPVIKRAQDSQKAARAEEPVQPDAVHLELVKELQIEAELQQQEEQDIVFIIMSLAA